MPNLPSAWLCWNLHAAEEVIKDYKKKEEEHHEKIDYHEVGLTQKWARQWMCTLCKLGIEVYRQKLPSVAGIHRRRGRRGGEEAPC